MICPPTLSLRAAHVAADLTRIWLRLRETPHQAQQAPDAAASAASAGAAGAAAASLITPSWCALSLNFPQAAYTTDRGLHQQLAELEPPQLTATLLTTLPRPMPLAMPQPGAAPAAAAAAAAPQQAAAVQARLAVQKKQQKGRKQQAQQERREQAQQAQQQPAKSAADTTGR